MKPQGIWLAAAIMTALAACKGGNDDASQVAPAPAAPMPQAVDQAQPALRDVIETNPRYIVGISFPPEAANYPGLARQLAAYADAAKMELMQAVDGLGEDKPTAPYELSLSFEITAATPSLVAASGDGSKYTGGAHGEPLVARFVWLPGQDKMLTASELIITADGWQVVSRYVADELKAQAVARARAEKLEPAEEEAMLRNVGKMIAAGTAPEPGNFDLFQPVMASGRIAALRFVFPPYQVGPYSDGTQSVDVPAEVLLPHVAPEYAGLFASP